MLLILFSLFAFSGEPDNFTGRNTPPQNEVVNRHIQQKLEFIAQEHNKTNKSISQCDLNVMDNLLESHLDRNWPDVYGLRWEMIVDGPEDVEKSVLSGDILRSKLGYSHSMTLALDKKNYSVGIDKIDHFFAHGYLNWTLLGKDPKASDEKIMKVLKFGEEQEDGTWGLKGLGVKSYGDLSANYQGISFWRDLWDGQPPFFVCEKGKVIVKKQFKIEEYLTGAVDEAINCSSYSSKKMAETVIQRTEKLGRKCPIDRSVCQSLVKKTPQAFQKYLFHPLCLGKPSDQVEEASSLSSKEILDTAAAMFSGAGNLTKQFLKQDNKQSNVMVFKKGTNEQIGAGEILNKKNETPAQAEKTTDGVR